MFFSVIIPIYNVEKYLRDSIESVLAQDFDNYELILVNDGSTDNSPQIVDAFTEKYKKIRSFHQNNRGLSEARNSGMKLAKGEYIFFLDSDDLMSPGILKFLHAFISSNELPDIVIGNMLSWFEEKKYYKNSFKESIVDSNNILDTVTKFVENYDWIPWAAYQSVYRRRFLECNELTYDPDIIGAEDCDFFINMLLHINSFRVINKAFVIYRMQREGSIISNPKKNAIEGQIKVFIRAFQFSKDIGNKTLERYFASRFANIIILLGYLDKDNASKAVSLVQENKTILKNTNTTFKYAFAQFAWKILGYYDGSKLLLKIRGGYK